MATSYSTTFNGVRVSLEITAVSSSAVTITLSASCSLIEEDSHDRASAHVNDSNGEYINGFGLGLSDYWKSGSTTHTFDYQSSYTFQLEICDIDDNVAFYPVTLTVALSAPNRISVPEMEVGIPATISWGYSTWEGATGFVLERSINGGTWTQIYKGSSYSYSDTPLDTWTTVAYRVKAYKYAGNGADWPANYKTSATVEVIHPASGLPAVIDGVERDTEMYCCVDGVTRKIAGDASIAGVAREIF